MRAKKRQEAAASTLAQRSISANTGSAKEQPLFEVDETWDEEVKKEKRKAKKEAKKREKERKGTIEKKSYVGKDYDPKEELKKSYEEKVEEAVEAAGVHAEEKRRHEIEIDPSKFLELNTNDLTQVSADFVEKMDQFDEGMKIFFLEFLKKIDKINFL